MKTLLLGLIASFIFINSAYAITADIAMSTNTPTVGEPVIFDGSLSTCDSLTGCSYQWQWTWRSPDGASHLGGQMGRFPTVTYTFDAFAASKPYIIVSLTVGAGRAKKPATAWVSFTVLP